MTEREAKIEDLKSLLTQAVNRVYAEENLIKNREGGSREGIEQSIVFRVGLHLHQLLQSTAYKDLTLDSEYNKRDDNPKRTPRFSKGVRPDLLLHQRGNQDSNILAVEFKGWWNKKHDKDIQKLEDLTNNVGEYKYLLGVFVDLQQNSPIYRYFSHPCDSSDS